ncbi:MAG: hypothetical protein HOG74_00865 [Nitrospina sp.]|jgi:hypothetical protein|nr:hypothetical protein [Nitrospina sp.]MBT5985140.1 hypothetical protein [Nitrospina sp.]
MSARKSINGSKSFPWKAIFGAISIIGVMVLFGTSENSNSVKSGSSSDQKGISGFSLK